MKHTITQPWLTKLASCNLENPATSGTEGALPMQSNSASILPSSNVSKWFLNPHEPKKIFKHLALFKFSELCISVCLPEAVLELPTWTLSVGEHHQLHSGRHSPPLQAYHSSL